MTLPSYSIAYRERLRQLQDSVSSAEDRKKEADENAKTTPIATPRDEIKPHGDSVQLDYKKQ